MSEGSSTAPIEIIEDDDVGLPRASSSSTTLAWKSLLGGNYSKAKSVSSVKETAAAKATAEIFTSTVTRRVVLFPCKRAPT